MAMLDHGEACCVKNYDTCPCSRNTCMCNLLTWPCTCLCLALNLRPDEFNGTWFTTWPCSHSCLPLEVPEKEKKKLDYEK